MRSHFVGGTLFLLLVAVSIQDAKAEDPMIVCYFTNWGQYRPETYNFMPGNVDPSLCTHIFYAFAKIIPENNTIEGFEWNDVTVLYPGIRALKNSNPNLRIILSLGGATMAQSAWMNASSVENVAAFSKNVISYLRLNQFDGLDVDWEWPNENNTGSYIRLMKALRATINAEHLHEGQARLFLSCAVTANSMEIGYYTPAELATAMDKLVIMAYDFYGTWSPVIGHHSPLYPSNEESADSVVSQHSAVEAWNQSGIALSQLVLGVAGYGRSFLLSSLDHVRPGDNHTGLPPALAPVTSGNSSYAYYEVCKYLQSVNSSWKEEWMNDSQVPYAYGRVGNKSVWVGYDNEASFRIKANYVKSRGLGGIMFWALDLDDFTGTTCRAGVRYPLLKAINSVLKKTSSVVQNTTLNGRMIVCYFTNWGQYRKGGFQYLPTHVDPFLCTHIFYAFAKINPAKNTVEGFEKNDVLVLYPGILQLKNSNPSLQVILSLGGATLAESTWLSASSPENVTAFSSNVIGYLRLHQFDGLDVDWEWPNENTTESYIRLMKELRAAFNAEQPKEGQTRLFLSCAVTANAKEIGYYSVTELAKAMDKLVIMTYDFYGTWSAVIGHHSPLYPSNEEPTGSVLSQKSAVEAWNKSGVPLSQLVLGVSSYGRSFLMSGLNENRPGDNFTGLPRNLASISEGNGTYAYFEICSILKNANGSWIKVWMNESQVPYAYGMYDGQPVWVGYDDEDSFRIKATYARVRGLGGIMVWALDLDDFTGTVCRPGVKYPLLKAVNDGMREPVTTTTAVSTATTSATTVTTTEAATAPNSTTSAMPSSTITATLNETTVSTTVTLNATNVSTTTLTAASTIFISNATVATPFITPNITAVAAANATLNATTITPNSTTAASTTVTPSTAATGTLTLNTTALTATPLNTTSIAPTATIHNTTTNAPTTTIQNTTTIASTEVTPDTTNATAVAENTTSVSPDSTTNTTAMSTESATTTPNTTTTASASDTPANETIPLTTADPTTTATAAPATETSTDDSAASSTTSSTVASTTTMSTSSSISQSGTTAEATSTSSESGVTATPSTTTTAKAATLTDSVTGSANTCCVRISTVVCAVYVVFSLTL